jgi:hypothetical protein
MTTAIYGSEHIGDSYVSCSLGEGCSSDTGGVFGDGTDGLWGHRHGSVLQEAGLLNYLPKCDAASPLVNKPTVSIRDLTLK